MPNEYAAAEEIIWVEKDKVWEVNFSNPVSQGTRTFISSLVKIVDEDNKKVEFSKTPMLSEDGKKLIVYPPVRNYYPNQKYKLIIDKSAWIKSEKNVSLKRDFVKEFKIITPERREIPLKNTYEITNKTLQDVRISVPRGLVVAYYNYNDEMVDIGYSSYEVTIPADGKIQLAYHNDTGAVPASNEKIDVKPLNYSPLLVYIVYGGETVDLSLSNANKSGDVKMFASHYYSSGYYTAHSYCEDMSCFYNLDNSHLAVLHNATNYPIKEGVLLKFKNESREPLEVFSVRHSNGDGIKWGISDTDPFHEVKINPGESYLVKNRLANSQQSEFNTSFNIRMYHPSSLSYANTLQSTPGGQKMSIGHRSSIETLYRDYYIENSSKSAFIVYGPHRAIKAEKIEGPLFEYRSLPSNASVYLSPASESVKVTSYPLIANSTGISLNYELSYPHNDKITKSRVRPNSKEKLEIATTKACVKNTSKYDLGVYIFTKHYKLESDSEQCADTPLKEE